MTRRPPNVPHAAARGGFSLAEITLALAIGGIVALAASGLILLTSRLLPENAPASSAAVVAATAMSALAADISSATGIDTASEHEVVLQLPDTDSDGKPETLEFFWPAEPGAAIFRTYNGNRELLVPGVHDFSLRYLVRTLPPPPDEMGAAGSTRVLRRFDPGGSGPAFSLSMISWISQYLCPPVLAGAVSWNLTSFDLRMHSGSTAGNVNVQVRVADFNGVPTSKVLYDSTFSSSTLPATGNPAFRTFVVPDVEGLPPQTCLCLVARQTSGADSARIIHRTGITPTAGTMLMTSSTGGTSWVYDNRASLDFIASGSIAVADDDSIVRRLDAIEVSLRAGDPASPLLTSTIRLPAAPVVEPP